MILRLALFLSGSLIGAVIGYRLRPWSDDDEEDPRAEEANPYVAPLTWEPYGEWLHPTQTGAGALPIHSGSFRIVAKADCE